MTTTNHPDLAEQVKRTISPIDFYRNEQAPLPTTRASADGWQDGGLCPFHDDSHAGNFRVNTITGGYKCFACDAQGGDIIDYTRARYGLDFRAAVTRLGAEPQQAAPRQAAPAKHAKKADYPPPWDWERLDILEAIYPYEDPDTGETVFEVLKSVDKEFKQRRPDPDKPDRWLYNLQGIDRPLFREAAVRAAVTASRKVFLVEGEKDVLNLATLGLTATSIAGGAKAPWTDRYTAALSGTTVLVIPDNDKPGHGFAQRVLLRLPDACLLELPGLPEHGDVSDWIAAGGTREDLVKLARQAIEARDNRPAPPPPDKDDPKRPFRCLGYNNGHYYFMTKRQGQVMGLTSSSLRSKPTFLELAPLNFWEGEHPGDSGPNWTAAADALIQACINAGLYDPSHRRGRGAWLDDTGPQRDTRVVLHHGDKLLVDGMETDIVEFETRYVYERAARLNLARQAPIDDKAGFRLFELCQKLPFEHSAASLLLSGWIAIAPICGVLRWRPHVWVTGPASSGKSWVMDHVVGGLLSGVALRVQSVTTEAGLRQALGQDARPVLFDEAEMEDQKSQLNVQRVLELARQASSETGAVIVKGSASGEVQTYNIRSCFCLASIGVGVRRRADETRVTVLSLRRPRTETEEERQESAQAFEDMQRIAADVCTPEYSAGLIARSCRLAKTIRTNAETFAVAVAQALGSRRTGDQLGALLAGYWSLWSDKEVTLDEATDYARGLNLADLAPDDETKDESRCFAHLLEQMLTVDGQSGPARQRSIGELVDAANNGIGADIAPSVANSVLQRHGIKATREGLVISNTHSAIAKLLNNTPWAIGWALFLKRLPGAASPTKSVTFPGHQVSRVTLIPWATINGDDEAQAEETSGTTASAGHGKEDSDDLPF